VESLSSSSSESVSSAKTPAIFSPRSVTCTITHRDARTHTRTRTYARAHTHTHRQTQTICAVNEKCVWCLQNSHTHAQTA
jgi:hypothetical protein